MFLRANDNLQESLIFTLGGAPNRTAKALQTDIAKIYKPCSLQAIYKELRGLQSRGVVVKANQLYSLSLAWVLKMIQFTDQLDHHYVRHRAMPVLLPKPGESKVWHFTRLRRLEDFWVHLLLVLTESSKDRILYQWMPQPWIFLVQHQRQIDFQEAMHELKAKISLIIGGRNFLQRAFLRYLRKDLYQVSLEPSRFERRRTVYLSVIGDYILRIRIDPRTAKSLDRFFSEVSSERDLKLEQVLELFRRQGTFSVTVLHNRARASELRRQFKQS